MLFRSSEAFYEAGYAYPKNLIEIDGLPQVERVIDSLEPLLQPGDNLICLIQNEENRRFHTADVIRLLAPSATVLDVPQPTSGAACTALLTIEHISNDEPLVIVNGDQIITADLRAVREDFKARQLDGGIVVFEAVHPRWSYVLCDANEDVVETAEKRPISNLATAGLYYFARGKIFVQAAMEMIKKDAHYNGAFYICPCYNEMILQHAKIGIHRIPRSSYISLATPQGVHAYEELLRAKSDA